MTVVAFVSQKGGVGKSTLCRALAVEAARTGLSVRVADLDVAQGSQVDLLLIDGPARADRDTLALARVADLVVLPSGASLDDLRPAVRVGHALTRSGIPAARLAYALTRIGTEAEAARVHITDVGYKVSSGYLPERATFRAAQNVGRAVTEVQYGTLRAAAERLTQSLIDAIPE
ncbi:ParA family protein [Roseomonas mucosa]|nr:ParA family protein [Roseomonas mucosa]